MIPPLRYLANEEIKVTHVRDDGENIYEYYTEFDWELYCVNMSLHSKEKSIRAFERQEWFM